MQNLKERYFHTDNLEWEFTWR